MSHTERVTSLLEHLHTTRERNNENSAEVDKSIDLLLDALDAMLDIASLDTLSRAIHRQEPRPTPYLEECNDLLASVDVAKVGTTEIMSLVRFTYMRRSQLSAWHSLRDRAVEELKQREPDRWQKIMFGVTETYD